MWKRRALGGSGFGGSAAYAVIPAMQNNGRDLNFGPLGERLLHGFETRFAGGVTVAMAIGVDHHLDEIRIIERWRGAQVGLLAKMPRRRPLLPQQAAQRAPILVQTGAAALGVEIPLIPERAFGFRGG